MMPDYDENVDLVGRELLSRCSMDSSCISKFVGRHPNEELTQLWNDINSNKSTCFDKIPGISKPFINLFQAHSYNLLSSQDPFMRLLIPPLIKRLSRCSSKDVEALSKFFSPTKEIPLNELPMSSFSLGVNIIGSEMVSFDGNPPRWKEIEQQETGMFFTPRRVEFSHAIWDVWPRYKLDGTVGEYSPAPQKTKVPKVMILQGDLDASTPFWGAQWVSEKYKSIGWKGNLEFVKYPTGMHSLLKTECGFQVLESFILSSGQRVDKSCLMKQPELDVEGKTKEVQERSLRVFGTANPWE